MSKVIDPDTLDRFQVCVDPNGEKISVRGLGTERHAVDQTGDSDGSTTFTDAGANFTADGVIAGDILTIISDPANNGGIIGHYRVVTVGTTTLTVERAIPASTGADLTYKINAKQTTGSASPQVADGVNMQALYSFLKEEWKVLAAGLGNAVDLNKFDFPFQSITPEEFITGGVNGDAASAWTFLDTNGTQAADTEGVTRELLRDAGWQERSAADAILREYANITTLGSLDTNAQAYYQQGRSDQTPVNFKLKGPVDQAIYTLEAPVTPTNIVFAATTITRIAGSWITDGFKLGDQVTIRSAEDAGNIGTFGPITALSATVITIASAAFTVNADDDTATFLPNHKFYTKLFCRKKARSYSSAVHADAGISTTLGIGPRVNKFPLSHANDPAITIQDGVLSGGDATVTGDIFQKVETHQSAANGVTQSAAASAADSFTFTSSGATFTSTARGGVQILRPGDSIEITSGSDQGVYEIKSVDSATQLTLFKEALKTYIGGESTLNYTLRTGIKDVGSATGDLADVSGATGTLIDSGGPATFNADNGLGDRTVAAGDFVEIFSGVAAHVGYYKVVSVDSATQLTLNTSDRKFTAQSGQSYRIWRPGMFLQRFSTNLVGASMTTMNFNGAGNPDTMTRTGGSWITDGWIVGASINVLNAEDAANIQNMIVGTPTPTATVLTLIAAESVTTNADDTVAINANITGAYGVIRSINLIKYPFHWRLFANGGTLSQVFQFLQRELRRTTDIDGGSGIERGDITDLLMSFASPNGTTLDLYPDDLATGDSNNVTFRDLTGDDRTNAFIVGITLDVNANLISSATKRLTMYFTTNPGGDFGTNNAIIVDDKDGVDINFTAIAGDIQTSFDYTNDAQGGRTPNTDANVTVVALGDDLAQHILAVATITKVNALTIAVQPALERNYANP
jgi:hypothetical protein